MVIKFEKDDGSLVCSIEFPNFLEEIKEKLPNESEKMQLIIAKHNMISEFENIAGEVIKCF